MDTLIVSRHPILIDHDTQVIMDLRPGETLYAFLHRHIENLDGQQMVVQLGDKVVPRHLWMHVKPKHGHNIIVRNTLHRSALFIVAMIALTVFTMGAGAAVAAGTSFGGLVTGGAVLGMGAAASMATIGAIQVVGALVINKVLGPKMPKAQSIDRDEVYSLGAARNVSRQYEPVGLLFGSVRVTPDVISMPYTQYRGNDQYLSMVLSPGINVDRYETLYLGDTPLSNYQDVRVWQAGFGSMPDQNIPVYTNADTIAGGVLEPGVAIVRTSSTDTVMLQVDISYLLFDLTSKGKKKNNQEDIAIQYRAVGSGTWLSFGNYHIVSQEQTEQRRSYTKDVAPGQYEVSVRRLGKDTDGSGATCEFSFGALVSYQRDTATYKGLARIGVEMKATGQLQGAPDEIRGVMYARPVQMWNGISWYSASTREEGLSNAAANVLQYLRGYRDEDGKLIAGMGLPEDMIDVESFKGWILTCTARNLNFDAWITGDRNHEDLMEAIGLAGMGRVTFAPGRATAVWAEEGQAVEAIVNMATIKKASFQVDYTLATAADGIEFSYFDRTIWDTKTLRVAAPGVTAVLNPATISGEGVTSEAHAALLARYHMAQMLYQFKDIVYATDLEHLAYGQLSMIELQHDLTQWGYGGRVVSCSNAGAVTLVLDEKVPAPSSGNAYIGLRIPGEASYRVFQVVPFVGETDTVTLSGSWPAGVPRPGSNADNPAHDTIWIYDFKQTPGLRCRVVAMSPEDDLQGASVSVVPEGQEFWDYVYDGVYVPPASGSLLNTRPVVSNLRIGEELVTQGDTVFTRLSASWDVSGKVENFEVTCGLQGGIIKPVANTTARFAEWRVDDGGLYTVTVHPFGEGGVPGVAQTLVVDTLGPDVPPTLIDTFNVTEFSGGMRRYEWDFHSTTIRSPDFAGVEIRYIAGTVPNPTWDSMTPMGNGYYTAAFETPMPVAGTWTFAVRSINTSGTLSVDQFVLTKVLTSNLDEILAGLDPEATTEALIAIQQQIDAETLARFEGDAATAMQAAADLLAQAQAQQAALDAERAARELAVAQQKVRIDAIDDDEILTPGEKPQLKIDVQAVKDEYVKLRAQMVLAEADTTELDAAYTALIDIYLPTLDSPVLWSDTSDVTYLT